MSNQNTRQLASEMRGTLVRLVKKMRKQSASGEVLSLTERSVIAGLDLHGRLLPSELAAMEHITTQSMSQVLNHLQELDLIIRTPSETDGRKVFISLSETGKTFLNKIRSEREEWLDKALQEFCTDEEIEQLQKSMVVLKRLADKV